MNFLKRFRAAWRISRVRPVLNLSEWTREDQDQLQAFFKSTSSGAKTLAVLRNGVVNAAMRSTAARDADEALRLTASAAGYAAAVSHLDELSGFGAGEAQGIDDTMDLGWMTAP